MVVRLLCVDWRRVIGRSVSARAGGFKANEAILYFGLRQMRRYSTFHFLDKAMYAYEPIDSTNSL